MSKLKLKLLPIFISANLLFGCGDPSVSENKLAVNVAESKSTQEQMQIQVQDQNQLFEVFKSTFLEEFWSLNPTAALNVGYYKYDDQLTIPDTKNNLLQLAFETKILSILDSFEIKDLNATNATDLAIIRNQVESSKWYRESFKEGEWNPSKYNVAGAFGLLLNTNYKSLDKRLKTISSRLEKVPAYYQAAIANIAQPTLEHTDLAIQQNNGALGIFQNAIPTSLKESTLTEAEKAAFQPKLNAAISAIDDYIGWLNDKRAKIADGGAKNFRIGEVLYEQKFKHDIVSDFTAKELFQKALTAKHTLHNHMIEITKQLWPKYFNDLKMPDKPLIAVKQMIDHLSNKHINRENFVDEVKRQIPIIEQFIIDNDLIDMDETRPLIIRETPEYNRGISTASVNSPGPYDATANTYYNVSPMDDYTDGQTESHLREYNHWVLQILNIHEALPGHYTQLMHANKSLSKIKSIFGNDAMKEGWAVYSERMMLEAGYANDEPEMWLMYSKWYLRVVVNTLLDYNIQVLGMTQEDGLNLLQNEAFQEKTEAEKKWRRASLTQVQLTSYFNGYSEIYAFREELKTKLGDRFNLKEFHNKFLSYGSAPVPVIRQLMLSELSLKNKD